MNRPIRDQENKINSYDYENSNPMSHEEAEEHNAVEHYVLNDLAPKDEVRFEEHYFGCRECARAVAMEQTLIGNRATVSRPSPEPWWRRLAFPILTPVTAALLTLSMFQNVHVIPTLNAELAEMTAAQPNTVILAKQVELGPPEGESIKTPSVTVEALLPFYAPRSPFYRVEILGQGRLPISQVVPAPGDRDRLSVHIASHALGKGSYDVFVYGRQEESSKDSPQIGQYHFNIQSIR